MNSAQTGSARSKNYGLMAADGVLFSSGIAFLEANTILPVVAASFGAPNWMIALMPVLSLLGFAWAPLVAAHYTETSRRMKPVILITGLFQRLAYLFAGLFLLFFAGHFPVAALCVIAATPFISGSFGGLGTVAYQELMARTVPRNRISSLAAIRGGATALIGIAVGMGVKALLAAHPGQTGFALLHLAAFAVIAVSYCIEFRFEETETHSVRHDAAASLLENLRRLPALFKGLPALRELIYARIFTLGIFIMIPFLSIHALETTGRENSYLGAIVMSQMLGGVCGNFFAGWTGDRGFSTSVFIGVRLAYALLCPGFALAAGAPAFNALFFLTGFTLAADTVTNQALTLRLCPPEKRPSYLALQACAIVPFLILFPRIGGWMKDHELPFSAAAALAMGFILLAAFFAVRFRRVARDGSSL